MADLLKRNQYINLVSDRKSCTLCKDYGLTNPSEVQKGKFDSDQIGPWTRWNGDIDAHVLIAGQDWGAINTFIKQRGKDRPDSGTNEMLLYLLASIGLDVKVAPNMRSNSGVFLTNAALCLKEGTDSSPVRSEWFTNCGAAFLRPQIKLINPRVVVALGKEAYLAICHAYTMEPVAKFTDAIGCIFALKDTDGIRMVPVSHCSPLAQNLNRPRSKQFQDWVSVKRALETTPSR